MEKDLPLKIIYLESVDSTQIHLKKLLTTNKIYIPDGVTRTRRDVLFEQRPLVIFTIENLSGLFPELYQAFDIRLTLEEYFMSELILILQQRIKYCGWKYSSDDALKMIAQGIVH